jgi:hypothetical protein
MSVHWNSVSTNFVSLPVNKLQIIQLAGLLCLVPIGTLCGLKLGGEIAFVSGNIGLPGSEELLKQSQQMGYVYLGSFVATVILAAYIASVLFRAVFREMHWVVRYLAGVFVVLVCDTGLACLLLISLK